MDQDKVYDQIIRKISQQKKYWEIVNKITGAVKTGRLSVDTVVGCVVHYANSIEDKILGKTTDKEASPEIITMYLFLSELVSRGYFSWEVWRQCVAEMVKIYAVAIHDMLEDVEKEVYLPPINNFYPDGSPVVGEFIMKFMVDGNNLAPNETAFYEWCAARFSEEEWCKKHGIKFDPELARILEEKYRRIGWTKDHTKLLPLPRRWQP